MHDRSRSGDVSNHMLTMSIYETLSTEGRILTAQNTVS